MHSLLVPVILLSASTALASTCTDSLLHQRIIDFRAEVPLEKSSAAILQALQRPPLLTNDRYQLLEPVPGVFFFYFGKQSDLTRSMIRFQEHYESPRFRNQIFSYREYVQWYMHERPEYDHRFTYFTDWAGFNFPERVTEAFYQGRFDPLTTREKEVLDLLRPYVGKKFYVIGAFKEKGGGGLNENLGTILHEVGHALFAKDAEYRAAVEEALKKLPAEDHRRLEHYLANAGGYAPEVFTDEKHAYLLESWERLLKKGLISWSEELKMVLRELNRAYESRF